MDLLKDLYNYEKYINKQYTSKQKEQYIKCIELLKEQNHSNHSINFVVNKFIDLLAIEKNYNKVLQENIKHFSKQKEGTDLINIYQECAVITKLPFQK